MFLVVFLYLYWFLYWFLFLFLLKKCEIATSPSIHQADKETIEKENNYIVILKETVRRESTYNPF